MEQDSTAVDDGGRNRNDLQKNNNPVQLVSATQDTFVIRCRITT